MNRTIHTLSTSRTAVILLLATLLTATTAQTARAWSGSGNSENDPILITNASDLTQLATNVNNGTDYNDLYFKQTANITLADAWTPIGTQSHPFKGHYDGGNFTISGLTVSGSYQYAGLFGYITSDYDPPKVHYRAAELKNINIVDCNIDVSSAGSGNGKAGGIAGYVNCFNMSNCKVSGTIKGYDYAAGLIGEAGSFCTMSGCFADVTVSAHKADPNAQNPPAYCLIGQYLNNMSASGNYYHNTAGVPVGISSATRLYAVTCQTDGLSMSQPTVSYGGKGYYTDGANVTISYTGPEGYQLAVSYNDGSADHAVSPDNTGKYVITMPDKDITVSAVITVIDWATAYQGDANDPYMIYNEEQLDLLAQRVNGGNNYNGKYFKLGNDINYPHTSAWNAFTSDESNYEAIGGKNRPFRGHFDGNNKTISGIRIYKGSNGDTDKYQGIFGRTSSGADIHDLTLADARITGYYYTGGIVGENDGGTVSGCHVADDVAVCAVQSKANYHGGIAGYNNSGGTIVQCTSAATLTNADTANSLYYGGIAGYNLSESPLRDNLAIGATVPAAKDKTYGAIIGLKYNTTLQRNYYAACKVAGVENATGVGCNQADVIADDGAVPGYFLTLGDGITSSALSITIPEHKELNGSGQLVTVAAVTYNVAAAGTTVWFNSGEPEGYSASYSVNGSPVSGNSITMPAANVTVTSNGETPIDLWGIAGGADGSSGHPYIITTTAGWNLLAGNVADGKSYSGKYFQLGADNISISTMVGASGHSFSGTFDGNGNTLTVDYVNTDDNVMTAPFSYVDGVTIQNLVVGGSISGTAKRAAGIIGETGTNKSYITNCVSSVNISSSSYTGGFSIGGNVEIEGCVFNGKINGTDRSGGFIGYSNSAQVIKNSLFAPQDGSSISGGTFYFNGGGDIAPVNSYYTRALGDAQGTKPIVTASNPSNIGDEVTAYNVSGITAYGNGLLYGSEYYCVNSQFGEIALAYSGSSLTATIGASTATVRIPEDVTVSSVTYNRTFTASKPSTVMLPFSLGEGQMLTGGKLYKFTGVTKNETAGKWEATMTETATLQANTPYLLMPDDELTDGKVTFDLSNGTVTLNTNGGGNRVTADPGSHWTFKGTYEYMKWTNDSNDPDYNAEREAEIGRAYGFAGVAKTGIKVGDFVRVASGAKIHPMRCYLLWSDTPSNARALTRGADNADELPQSITVRLVGSNGEMTAIGTIDTETCEFDLDADSWYDMNGRRLSGKPSQKGVYIRNGKKTVVK